MTIKKIVMFLICTSIIISSNCVSALEFIEDDIIPPLGHGTGLIMPEEEIAEFHSRIPKIVNVMPNEIALSRVEQGSIMSSDSNRSSNRAAEIGNEIMGRYNGETVLPGQSGSAVQFPLASSVDVSESLTFPNIANQGNFESCVPWSLVYYQLTNNTCVIRNQEAKTDSGADVTQNIMSPRWIYAMTNFGRNIPTFYAEACAALMSYGCPETDIYSRDITTSNLSQWCVDSEIWESAFYNKPEQIMYDEFTDNELYGGNIAGSNTLTRIKQILSNGYVLTYSTNVGAYNYTQETSNGEWACRYVGTDAEVWHAMTIVGYDDDYWIDVNDNGVHDSGETGALKIANSWGTNANHYSDGYLWLSYDAIGEVSGVSGMPTDRDRAIWAYYFIKPYKEYEPIMVANVTIRAERRNQIGIELGVLGDDAEEKISIVPNYHVAFSTEKLGNNRSRYTSRTYNFSGGTTEQEITLPIDLTPLLQKVYANSEINKGEVLKLNITVNDSDADTKYTYLKDVSITEKATGISYSSSNTDVLSANNSSVSKSVDFIMPGYIGHDREKTFTLNFSNNVYAGSVTDNSIFISDTSDNIYNTDLFIENKKIYVDCLADEGFMYNKIYKLNIDGNIMSVGRNKLIEQYVIPIYILGSYNEFFI